MNFVKAFLAGFFATLVFHQGLLAILHAAGATGLSAWAMKPTPPLGVPQVFSLAFWGGVWGIALWLAVRRLDSARYWLASIAIGAIAPSAIAFLVVLPLKGVSVPAPALPKMIFGALLLNGVWGFGAALGMRLVGSRAGQDSTAG
jgi:hypothetical protein